jgi:hypothetical protein
MAESTVQLKVTYTDRQRQASEALSRSDIKRLLYGGAKGGGKSYFMCVWSFLYAWAVCVNHELMPSSNPPHIGWLGRKQGIDFTATTLQTWRTVIPEQYYVLRGGTEKDSKHILIMDRVAIDYGGLDRQETINKFNSSEYGFIGIDQAEEVGRDDISVLRGSLRMTIGGKALPYKELYTANPRACWLRDDFITNCLPGSLFVPALPADNPHLPADYEQTLIDAFGYRPALLSAYLHGDWSQIEDEAQVILDVWLASAICSDSLLAGRVISCDVARFGDDKTEIMVLEGSDIIFEHTMPYSRTTEVSSYLAELSRENDNCAIVVDEIGVGGGVVDQLYEFGRRVIAFNSSKKADDEEKFYNKRAEAWWSVAEHLSKRELGCSRMGIELRKQLAIPTYEFRNGKILIESKKDIKARMQYSPDKADCYVMGIWGIEQADMEIQYAGHNENKSYWNDNLYKRGNERKRRL